MAVNTYNLFPHNTPTALTIQGTVFKTPATFLLDTGASVSLLRHDVWQQANTAEQSLRPWIGNSLVGVDGTPLTLHGCADITIHLSNIPFTTTIVIADGLTTEAILGLDFLQTNRCVLDMGQRTLQVSRYPPIPLSPPQPHPSSSPLIVSLVDTVRIPPASELEVLACVHM